MSWLICALLCAAGLCASLWHPGVPLALALALIVAGAAELLSFTAGLPARLGPVLATGCMIVGALGLLLLGLSLVA